jgi:hypothetical protein
MSGFMGKQENINTTPQDIRGLREQVVNFLTSGGLGQVNSAGTKPGNVDDQFFMNNILSPYRDMYAANRAGSLAQAKESAGNLTGSGYNNLFGSALANSLAQENAGLAQTRMGLRQNEQQYGLQRAQLQQQNQQFNAQQFLQMLLGMSTTGVGAEQPTYKPGFLDHYTNLLGTVVGAAGGSGGGR